MATRNPALRGNGTRVAKAPAQGESYACTARRTAQRADAWGARPIKLPAAAERALADCEQCAMGQRRTSGMTAERSPVRVGL